MLTKFGENTETLFLKGFEAHKLHHEFTVASGEGALPVRKAQPVKLNAEGEVVPAAAAEDGHKIIGYSIHNGNPGELVTIALKAYGIVYCKPKAAVVAGPVEYDGQNTAEPEYISVKAASAAGKLMGWALDEAESANEMIRLALI